MVKSFHSNLRKGVELDMHEAGILGCLNANSIVLQCIVIICFYGHRVDKESNVCGSEVCKLCSLMYLFTLLSLHVLSVGEIALLIELLISNGIRSRA